MLYKGEVRRDYTYARQFRRIVIDVALFFLLPHYGSWWKLRVAALSAKSKLTKRLLERCYRNFVDRFGAYIPLNASIDYPPCFPHELYGIFISNKAKIGRNVTIFQQVTIGSNTLKGSSSGGAPQIGDNVIIGAGAKIIGDVRIGNNCRIGAGACVTKDLPDNTVAVSSPLRLIEHKEELDNRFFYNVPGRENTYFMDGRLVLAEDKR